MNEDEIKVISIKKRYQTPKPKKKKVPTGDWHTKNTSNGHSPSRRRKSKEITRLKQDKKNKERKS